MDTLRPGAEVDHDTEIDQLLREIGNELVEHEVPPRLLNVVRAAANVADQASSNVQGGGPASPPNAKPIRTRGR